MKRPPKTPDRPTSRRRPVAQAPASTSSSSSVGSSNALIIAARKAISSTGSVVAEIDEVPTGERTARLLQAAADHEPAEIDRHEAETRDQALDEFDWLGVVPDRKMTRRPPFLRDLY
jgi:hypothetical protein